MAVDVFHGLTFGGIKSTDYGIYITGQAVYNAPERAVELVSVPGRNGALVIDQGRWENIEVTYPAGCFAADSTNFATAIADFRNAIASQIGYQRLSDDYNPDEYRMALYVSGLDVSPVSNNKAGEFELIFNCKPQRWLTSGEDDIAVTDGDTLTNPTLFDARPLVKAIGQGTISLNGQEIRIQQKELGRVSVASPQDFQDRVTTRQIDINGALLSNGDPIYVDSLFKVEFACKGIMTLRSIGLNPGTGGMDTADFDLYDNYKKAYVSYTYKPQMYKGTPSSGSGTGQVDFIWYDVDPHNATLDITCSYTYDGDSTITLSYTTIPEDPAYYWGNILTIPNIGMSIGETIADSTRLTFTDPIYIDCDLGEAYTYVNGEAVSLNNLVSLGSDLPILAPGANTVTYDNTITSLEIVPRWWQL